MEYPERIISEAALEELLSTPGKETIEMFSRIAGDIMFLGVGGKIGPTLALMARRACNTAGVEKRIYGVSLFNSDQERKHIEDMGVETIDGDLLDTDFIKSLPKIKNVFLVAILFMVSTTLMAQNDKTNVQNQEMQTFDTYDDVGYDQDLRPQFHFSSLKGWLNDPNGMVWYDGEYHLYFQHNPKDVKWGNMTWGHAVSTDMVHWEQLPHAILPYGGGTIFSGTAVVDHKNFLGKQTGDTKTLVAYFSFAKEPFYQAAAYSTDKGRTFSLVNNGGSVVPNQGFDKSERDPKVFWHEESQKWVMVLWVLSGKEEGSSEEKLGKVLFFTSENMVDWEVASDFNRAWVYECMDFVELPVDGDKNNKKWLLYDASFDYEIGDFDGKTFTTDKKIYKGDSGTDFYARNWVEYVLELIVN